MTEEHPIAYTALQRGTQVLSSDGDVIGTVERVLDIPDLDLFDGIVVETPGGDRFVDRDQIDRITNLAVHCALTTSEAATLPLPDSAPTYRADPRRMRGTSMMARLKRRFGRATWNRDHDDE
ncbi:MAG TPA: hypothetical protein VH419_06400 [Nocardioidaceae bacterium]|jgi:hypothetical protein